MAAKDERRCRGRRSRVVLTPRCWRQVLRKYPLDDGGNKAGHRGEHEVSRNPSRRESRIASAGPVCSCAHFFVHIAHETAGAARIRLSLRPLLRRRAEGYAKLGHIVPRERGFTSSRCLKFESDICASRYRVVIAGLDPARPLPVGQPAARGAD